MYVLKRMKGTLLGFLPKSEILFLFIILKSYTVKLNELNTNKSLKLSVKNK
jgi:hypothetical protein